MPGQMVSMRWHEICEFDDVSVQVFLQCLLHMAQVEFALGTAKNTAKVQNLGQSWGHV